MMSRLRRFDERRFAIVARTVSGKAGTKGGGLGYPPMLIAALLAQAQPADIEFRAAVRARSLTIEKQGQAELVISSDPEGQNLVDIRAPKANGRKTIRNPQVDVDVEVRIADPVRPRPMGNAPPR